MNRSDIVEFEHLRVQFMDWLDEQLAIRTAMFEHEWFYGVPCGPTLSMTKPETFAYWAVRS